VRTHERREWLYVLSGELRPILAGHDVTVQAREGERIHVRASRRRKGRS
jgi:hypothetical protein